RSEQHPRVARDFFYERAEISERVPAERVVLQPHEVAVSDFLDAGRKMAVPKQRHFLEKRRRAVHHPVEPPMAKIENLFALHRAQLARLLLKILTPIFC